MKANGSDIRSQLETIVDDEVKSDEYKELEFLNVLDHNVVVPVIANQAEALMPNMRISPPLKETEKASLQMLLSNEITGGEGAQRRRQWMEYRRDDHKKEYLLLLVQALRGDPEYAGELNDAEHEATSKTIGS